MRAAFMLIPLLGGPALFDAIQVYPDCAQMLFWTIWVYLVSVAYVFQGFFIALLYCFTNREVITTLRQSYGRYRLRNATGAELRRGSRGRRLRLSRVTRQPWAR